MNINEYIHANPSSYHFVKRWFEYLASNELDVQSTLKSCIDCTSIFNIDDFVDLLEKDIFVYMDFVIIKSNDKYSAIYVLEDEYSETEFRSLEYIYYSIENCYIFDGTNAISKLAKYVKKNVQNFSIARWFTPSYKRRESKHSYKPATRDYLEWQCKNRYNKMVEIAFKTKIVKFVQDFVNENHINDSTSWKDNEAIYERFVAHCYANFIKKYCQKVVPVELDSTEIIENVIENGTWFFEANAVIIIDGNKCKYNFIDCTVRNFDMKSTFKAYISMLFAIFNFFNRIEFAGIFSNCKWVLNNFCNLKLLRGKIGDNIAIMVDDKSINSKSENFIIRECK